MRKYDLSTHNYIFGLLPVFGGFIIGSMLKDGQTSQALWTLLVAVLAYVGLYKVVKIIWNRSAKREAQADLFSVARIHDSTQDVDALVTYRVRFRVPAGQSVSDVCSNEMPPGGRYSSATILTIGPISGEGN